MNLIKAGEASGSLDDVLLRLGKHQEQMAEVREKVIGALIYPLIIVAVGICTIIFFMMVMVPRFSAMFKEMGTTMPLPTRILIGVSDKFVSYWWIGVLLVVVGGDGLSDSGPHAGGEVGAGRLEIAAAGVRAAS